MKKFPLGLLVAAVTFFCGVAAVAVFNFKKEIVSQTFVEKIRLVEAPPIKVEPLPAPLNIEENIEEEYRLDTLGDERLFSGWYRLGNFAEMSEVNAVALGRDYGAHERSDEIISHGGVLAASGKDGATELFFTYSATIDDKRVKFRTVKIRGIEYRFEGAFLTGKTTGADGEILLRGTLKKFKKGKKIAEIGGDFAYYEPRCWH